MDIKEEEVKDPNAGLFHGGWTHQELIAFRKEWDEARMKVLKELYRLGGEECKKRY